MGVGSIGAAEVATAGTGDARTVTGTGTVAGTRLAQSKAFSSCCRNPLAAAEVVALRCLLAPILGATKQGDGAGRSDVHRPDDH